MRVDEHLAVLRQLWSAEKPAPQGTFASFSGVQARPRPRQPGGPPIIVGGATAPARRRALRHGHGWYVFNVDPDLAQQAMDLIHAEAGQVQRPEHLGDLEVTITPKVPFDEHSRDAYAEAGVDRVVLLPGGGRREHPHAPVPVDDILHTIDSAAAVLG